MDRETEVQMKIPRCGNHDNDKLTSLQERVRRYVLIGSVWHHMNLTFKITKYSKKISNKEVDESASKSLKVIYITYMYNSYIYIKKK